ncbi:uncharacterized protein V6R79_026185 [Siganus canaliculatus]
MDSAEKEQWAAALRAEEARLSQQEGFSAGAGGSNPGAAGSTGSSPRPGCTGHARHPHRQSAAGAPVVKEQRISAYAYIGNDSKTCTYTLGECGKPCVKARENLYGAGGLSK